MRILKSLLLLFSFFILSTSGNSQLVLNPKAGFNASGVEEELDDYEAEARLGFNVGIDVRVPGERAFYFNPGLHYYRYTARLVRDPGQGSVELKDETSINAMKIPLRLGYRLTGEGGLIGIHVRAGLAGTLILGVKESDDFPFSKDALKSFTTGADIGVCLEIFNLITADLNYEIGLTDYFEDVEGGNNVLTVSFGLKF